MRSAFRFGRLFLLSPGKAAAAAAGKSALSDSLAIYAATLLAALLFLYVKPPNFPDINAAIPIEPQGLFFWLEVILWQPPLMSCLIVFTAVLLHWHKDGWLPIKVATSFIWCAVPLLLTVLYAKSLITKFLFAVLMACWAVPAGYAGKSIDRKEWRLVACFLLGLNAVECVAFFPELIVTFLRWETGYKIVASIAGLWMLLAGALGLRELPPGRPLPRALIDRKSVV